MTIIKLIISTGKKAIHADYSHLSKEIEPNHKALKLNQG